MRLALTTILALGLAVPGGAADPSGSGEPFDGIAPEGARVRIKLQRSGRIPNLPAHIEGRLGPVSPGGVRVRLNAYQEVTVPARAIERFQVSAGRHSRARGAGIGAGIGVLLGLGLGGLALATCDDGPDSWECVSAGANLIGLPPILGAGGAIVGALLPPSERWEEVPRERLRVTAGPILKRDGAGVAVAVSF
jgi:hypothetical protein